MCICQWDYKTRIANQNELLAQLRAMLNNMLQQKQRFKDACIDTEAALKVTGRCFCFAPPLFSDYFAVGPDHSSTVSTRRELKLSRSFSCCCAA